MTKRETPSIDVDPSVTVSIHENGTAAWNGQGMNPWPGRKVLESIGYAMNRARSRVSDLETARLAALRTLAWGDPPLCLCITENDSAIVVTSCNECPKHGNWPTVSETVGGEAKR